MYTCLLQKTHYADLVVYTSDSPDAVEKNVLETRWPSAMANAVAKAKVKQLRYT